MKLSNSFMLTNLHGKFLLASHQTYLSVNDSFAFLWNLASGLESFQAGDLAEGLLKEYRISREEAGSAAQTVIEQWRQIGALEEP